MAEATRNDWYRDGTVNVTSGSTTVTGSKTYWSTAGINSGATFRIDGMPNDYEIASVVSDTEIQLRRPYYGSNLSNQAYSIDPNRTSTILADIAARNAAMMGRYEKFIDDNYHTVAGESAYDIAKRLGKTTAATESAWIDELKAGTEYTTYKNAVNALLANEAGNHNAMFFDKNLGAFTDAISATIRAGTFEGIYPGCYFDFSNIPYSYLDENDEEQSSTYSGRFRIMDLDYFRRCGDTDLTAHHVVVVPDTPMFSSYMNPTNTTEGGYVGSVMRTKILRRAEAIVKACFGADHVLKHREYLVNAVTDGKPTGGAWCDSLVELMDERMVYGSCIFDSGSSNGTTVYNRYTTGNAQLAGFRHKHELVSNRQWYYLRNIVSAGNCAYVSTHGNAYFTDASGVGGVRPASLIY